MPGLEKNIKNGNSLIQGTSVNLKKYFGNTIKRSFNWHEEFPEVFEQGGFDVIVGNPPYIFARGQSFETKEKEYYYNNFKLQKYQINTFLLFIEQGYNLLKKNGLLSYIIPNNWLTINSFATLREFLLKNTGNLKIINCVDKIFGNASVDTCILSFTKHSPTDLEVGELKDGNLDYLIKRKPEDFFNKEYVIKITRSKETNIDFSKVFNQCLELKEVSEVKSGLVAYEVGKGSPPQTLEMKDQRIYHLKNAEDNTWIKYLAGVDVGRYYLDWSGEFIKYGKNLSAPRDFKIFSEPRILVRQIPSKPPYCINAVFTDQVFVNDRNSNNILNPSSDYNLKYLLGVINSKLLSYWFIQTFDKFQRKIFPQFKVNELESFPIHKASHNEQKPIIEMVDKILQLQIEKQTLEKNSNAWNYQESEVEKTSEKLDKLVYQLYNLTPQEIETIESKEVVNN